MKTPAIWWTPSVGMKYYQPKQCTSIKGKSTQSIPKSLIPQKWVGILVIPVHSHQRFDPKLQHLALSWYQHAASKAHVRRLIGRLAVALLRESRWSTYLSPEAKAPPVQKQGFHSRATKGKPSVKGKPWIHKGQSCREWCVRSGNRLTSHEAKCLGNHIPGSPSRLLFEWFWSGKAGHSFRKGLFSSTIAGDYYSFSGLWLFFWEGWVRLHFFLWCLAYFFGCFCVWVRGPGIFCLSCCYMNVFWCAAFKTILWI